MHTRVCDMFGIEIPLFGFSHCRDVVAAISKAGGLGVFGAAEITPAELELELQWLDEQLAGRPYGVDVLVAAKHLEGDEEELEERIPDGHRRFVAGLEERFGIPPLPEGADTAHGIHGTITFRDTDDAGEAALDVALRHPVKAIVSALGPAPRAIVERAHAQGVLVGGMCGSTRHAQKHVANGADFVVAAGHEGAGHNSQVSTMILVPEIVDAVGPVPVLAAGGIGNGRQVAAALALGAEGVWTGSLWVACAESEFLPEQIEAVLRAGSHDTIETRSFSGKPTRFLRNPWNAAWDEPDAPDPLPTPLQHMLVRGSHHKIENARMHELYFTPVGQIVGQITAVRSVEDIIFRIVEEFGETMERMAALDPA